VHVWEVVTCLVIHSHWTCRRRRRRLYGVKKVEELPSSQTLPLILQDVSGSLFQYPLCALHRDNVDATSFLNSVIVE
jgi:hypothetical protein